MAMDRNALVTKVVRSSHNHYTHSLFTRADTLAELTSLYTFGAHIKQTIAVSSLQIDQVVRDIIYDKNLAQPTNRHV